LLSRSCHDDSEEVKEEEVEEEEEELEGPDVMFLLMQFMMPIRLH